MTEQETERERLDFGKLLKMAAYWLEQAADMYGNHGCNDLPKEFIEECGLKDSEKVTFATAFEEWNGSLPDALMDGPIKPSRFDNLLADMLKHKAAADPLREELVQALEGMLESFAPETFCLECGGEPGKCTACKFGCVIGKAMAVVAKVKGCQQ